MWTNECHLEHTHSQAVNIWIFLTSNVCLDVLLDCHNLFRRQWKNQTFMPYCQLVTGFRQHDPWICNLNAAIVPNINGVQPYYLLIYVLFIEICHSQYDCLNHRPYLSFFVRHTEHPSFSHLVMETSKGKFIEKASDSGSSINQIIYTSHQHCTFDWNEIIVLQHSLLLDKLLKRRDLLLTDLLQQVLSWRLIIDELPETSGAVLPNNIVRCKSSALGRFQTRCSHYI